MKDFKKVNYEKLLEGLGEKVEGLSPQELKTLEWLAGWEPSTVKNMCSIFKKIKGE